MSFNLGDINKDLGNIHKDISTHNPGEQQNFRAGMTEMMAGQGLKELNQVFNQMGIQVPGLDQMEKNLTNQGMQDLFDSNLTGKDLKDLYSLKKDLHI